MGGVLRSTHRPSGSSIKLSCLQAEDGSKPGCVIRPSASGPSILFELTSDAPTQIRAPMPQTLEPFQSTPSPLPNDSIDLSTKQPEVKTIRPDFATSETTSLTPSPKAAPSSKGWILIALGLGIAISFGVFSLARNWQASPVAPQSNPDQLQRATVAPKKPEATCIGWLAIKKEQGGLFPICTGVVVDEKHLALPARTLNEIQQLDTPPRTGRLLQSDSTWKLNQSFRC